MPGLVINGRREQLPPELTAVNYLDDPALRLGEGDRRARDPKNRWVHLIVLHTTKGIPGGDDHRDQDLRPGYGPSGTRVRGLVGSWTKDSKCAGSHLIVDFDGTITCCADLQTEAAYHAGHANEVSIGIEIVQGASAELYQGQLGVVVQLCDWLTRRFQIQRQIPHRYVGPSRRLMGNVADVVGIVGHRDLSNRRGAGDPGNYIFNRLGVCGYELLDFDQREDLDIWGRRQRELGVKVDRIPGPKTCAAIRAADAIPGLQGRRLAGLWVKRPGDPE